MLPKLAIKSFGLVTLGALAVSAAPAERSFTGTLKTGVVAIGGETTGIELTDGKTAYELDLHGDKALLASADKLAGTQVTVTGVLKTVKGVEIRERHIIVVSSLAAAPGASLKGEKARGLARALKFAGVKPAIARTRTFRVGTLDCWSSFEGEDEQLGDYRCTLDKTEIKGGLALLLQDAMESAGMASDDHMSQHTTRATSVGCVIDPTKAGDDRFACSFAQNR